MKKQIVLLLLLALMFICKGLAQEPTTSVKVECGGSVESEFTQPVELHEYIVSLSAGDKLNIAVVPIGDYLTTAIALYEPSGNYLVGNLELKQTPQLETGILSARGDYKVYILNYRAFGENYGEPLGYGNNNEKGIAGTYTVLIGCTLRDGTEIAGGSQ